MDYTYVDITSSISSLKEYLAIRDFNEIYGEVRESGRVGIPAIKVNGKMRLVSGKEDLSDFIKANGLNIR